MHIFLALTLFWGMRNFCLSQGVPLHVSEAEEFMSLDFIQTESWKRVFPQQLDNQIMRICIAGRFVSNLVAIVNVLVSFELGFPNKGRSSIQHLIQDNAEGPQVGSVGDVCVI